jgi:hypothetical protein
MKEERESGVTRFRKFHIIIQAGATHIGQVTTCFREAEVAHKRSWKIHFAFCPDFDRYDKKKGQIKSWGRSKSKEAYGVTLEGAYASEGEMYQALDDIAVQYMWKEAEKRNIDWLLRAKKKFTILVK